MHRTRIFIADAHTLTREGLKSLLSRNSDLQISGEAHNGHELRSTLNKSKSDIVVIDYSIAGHFSIDDVAFLRKEHPTTAVLVISANRNKQDIIKVLDYGVHSYLLKECDEEEILSAIHATAKKEKFFCGKIMDAILEEVTHKCSPDEPCDHCQAISLSSREVEVIQQIALGNTTKAIAGNLNLSFHTVGTHRKNIFKKLRVRSSSELILFALEKGIIRTDT